MKEKSIQNAIIREFGTKPWARLMRANVGSAVPLAVVRSALAALAEGNVAGAIRTLRKAAPIKFGVPGQADLTAIMSIVRTLTCPHCSRELSTPPLGVRLEIEVKSAHGRQSKDQVNYQAMIERFGGIYILARSVEDVHQEIERLAYEQGIRTYEPS